MNTETTKNTIGRTILGIQFILLIYFLMALGFLDRFSAIKNQVDIATKVMRPFIAVLIPIFNIAYTLVALFMVMASIVMTTAKYIDSEKVVTEIAKMKQVKRNIVGKIMSLMKSLILVWLAWTYGAHYMGFLFFLMIILSVWLNRTEEKTIEAMKDKVVKILADRVEDTNAIK